MTVPTVREGDDPAAESWKRRRSAMSPEGPAMAVNGWMARARFISLLLKDLSGGTIAIVLLGVVLGWLSGYVPLPIVDNYFVKMANSNAMILDKITRIEERQNKLIGIFITGTKVACENSARDAIAKNNCLNIHE